MMRMGIEQGKSMILMETARQMQSILTPMMRMEIEQGMREILMETAQ